MWPAHLLSQHEDKDDRDSTDISVYVVIVMMLYAAGIILMMVRYGGGGGGRRRHEDDEDTSLLGEGVQSSRTIPARFFQAIMGKNGGTRHTLDLSSDQESGVTV